MAATLYVLVDYTLRKIRQARIFRTKLVVELDSAVRYLVLVIAFDTDLDTADEDHHGDTRKNDYCKLVLGVHTLPICYGKRTNAENSEGREAF